MFITVLWGSLFGLSSLLLIAALSLSVSLTSHWVLALAVIVLLVALKFLRPTGLPRAVFLSFALAIVARYVYWRTTSTIPPITELQNFIPGIILYVAEMYSVLVLLMSLFVVIDPVDRARAPQLAPERLPTVDVLVPSYNESADILVMTLASAKAMDYPAEKLAVYLLDDGATEERLASADETVRGKALARQQELMALCERLGVQYLARANNANAKAGNLNAALPRIHGELVVVFDADHAPARDFLMETVGFFSQDPKLFLVQTPHFFLNPDPLERNLQFSDKVSSESDQFYGLVQRGMDKWNATFFCGSAAVLRRSALNDVGGFSGISITEDCETALELHARGWTSIYVSKPMIAGLQPETYSSFIRQRSRWAQGMMQIFMLKHTPFKRGLTLAQRICYCSSQIFWLFPYSRLIFTISPLLYLFFGLQIFDSSGYEFAAYTIVYVLVNALIQSMVFGNYRWPWMSELYEYVQSVYLIRAVTGAIISPRKGVFKVTAKDEVVERDRISALGWPFYGIVALLALGVVATVVRYIFDPFSRDVTLVVGAWNLINLMLGALALGVVAERRNLRRAPRVDLGRAGELIVGEARYPVTISDGSMAGLGLSAKAGELPDLKPGEKVRLAFHTRGPVPEGTLSLTVRNIHQEGATTLKIGCDTPHDDVAEQRLLADLLFAESGRWQQRVEHRRSPVGIIRAASYVFYWTVRHGTRALGYLRLGPDKPGNGSASAPQKPL